MQFNYGYMKVKPEAMIAVMSHLEGGRWAAVQLVSPDQIDANTSFFTVLKVLLIARLSALAEANRPETKTLQDADARFDRAQRRYALEVMKHRLSDDAEERDAADALAAETLQGNGFGQTTLSYAEEADFGEAQLSKLDGAVLKAYVALLKLEPFVQEISAAVDELVLALGRDFNHDAKQAPSTRLREAHRQAALAFDHVHGALDDLAAQNVSDAYRKEIQELLHPLKTMLDESAGA